MKFEIYTYNPHIYDLCDQVQLVETYDNIQEVRECIEYEAQILTEEYDYTMVHCDNMKKHIPSNTKIDLGNWVRNLPIHTGESTWFLYDFPNIDELVPHETYMLMESCDSNMWVMVLP